jgi:tetratricopeptide (TPR) repeat protein
MTPLPNIAAPSISIRSTHWHTTINLGLALAGQGKLDEAIAEYRHAIELDPKNGDPHNNLGLTLKDQGKLDDAIAEYHHAIELNPKNENAHAALDQLLEKHNTQ